MIVIVVTIIGSILSAIATRFAVFLTGRALQDAILSAAFLCY